VGGPLSGVVRWLLWAAARLGARIRTFAALDFAALSAVSKRHPRWSSSTAADSYTAGWRRARRHRRARGAGRQAAVGGGGAARQLSTSEKGRLHPRRPFLVPRSLTRAFCSSTCIGCSAEREREGEPIL